MTSTAPGPGHRRRARTRERGEFVDERGESPQQLGRDLVIASLAVVSVAIGIYQIYHPAQSGQITFLDVVDLCIVVFFLGDFVWQGVRCGDWPQYLKRHWWEIPSLIPASAFLYARVPGLTVARGVRALRLVRVLRLMRVVGMARRVQDDARYVLRLLHRARLGTLLLVAVFIVGMGSVASYLLESDVNPSFRNGGDAFWWAFNMVTNVAYVDFQPLTVGGRVLAGVLELCGIGFVGVFTASLANAIVKEPTPAEEERSETPE